MTKEGNKPALKFCCLQRGDTHNENTLHVFDNPVDRDSKTIELIFGEDLQGQSDAECWDKYRAELLDSGSVEFEGDPGLEWFTAWIPTPPTPAGAGTETPLDFPDSGMMEDVSDIIGRNGWNGLAATVRSANEALTVLRRQAEADRATLHTLCERIECDAQDNSALMSENTSLRAQLASADKDRERMRAALEMASGRMAYMAGAFGNRFSDEDKNINRVVFKEIRAALQPSASLDHGATDIPQL